MRCYNSFYREHVLKYDVLFKKIEGHECNVCEITMKKDNYNTLMHDMWFVIDLTTLCLWKNSSRVRTRTNIYQ